MLKYITIFLILFSCYLYSNRLAEQQASTDVLTIQASGNLLSNQFDVGIDVLTPDQSRQHQSRGYLTTPAELRQIKYKAEKGIEPYQSAVDHVIAFANRKWEWEPPSGRITCLSSKKPGYLMKGNTLIYAKALAYHLTGRQKYAIEVMNKIAGLSKITSVGEPGDSEKPDRQCHLNLSWAMPGYIRAADLLENNRVWQGSGLKQKFQDWLSDVVYPTISFTAEVSMSNWGSAATNTCAYIADYLWDRPNIDLVSYNRYGAYEPTTVRTPAEAYQHAMQLALERMNGTRSEGKGGSSRACDSDPETKSMIRPDGGIPDELRRGSTSCYGTRILENDKSNMYSQTHLEGLIAQAELMLRRGDNRLYENIQNDSQNFKYTDSKGNNNLVTLPPGRGSLKKAVLFILDYPSYQKPRSLRSSGEIVYRYYRHPAMLKAVINRRPSSGGRTLAFETLTHGFAEGEITHLPPTVPPPESTVVFRYENE